MNVLQEGLNNICEEIKPDLVVMGLTGKTRLTKLIVGSNTIQAVHDLTYPVLVVPPQATFIPIRKIGFACDYKKVKETTPVNLLQKFVRDFNAELHVMNIDFENKYFGPESVQENIQLYEMLEDYKPEYHNIESEDITLGINHFAEKTKIDWMVVIPKKHNLLHRIFGRSHTQDLIYHTHIPVLCIHE
jgi:nucleotide-binding universal stress UspA family protein